MLRKFVAGLTAMLTLAVLGVGFVALPAAATPAGNEGSQGSQCVASPGSPAVEEVSHVVHHPAVTHDVHHPAVTHTVHHPAVTHTVHHDAVTHVVHHAATPDVKHTEYRFQTRVHRPDNTVEHKYVKGYDFVSGGTVTVKGHTVSGHWIVSSGWHAIPDSVINAYWGAGGVPSQYLGGSESHPKGDVNLTTYGGPNKSVPYYAALVTITGGYTEWGPWSGWSTTNPGASSDTLKVESQVVIDTKGTAAWDETVTDTAAYDEVITDSAAYDEVITDSAAYDETITDSAAWDEKVIDTPAKDAVPAILCEWHTWDTHTWAPGASGAGDVGWPQDYVGPGQLTPTVCEDTYQQDLYRGTRAEIDAVIGDHVLDGPNPPEDHNIVVAWAFASSDACPPPPPHAASVSFEQVNVCADLDGSGDLTVTGAHLVSATWNGEPYSGPLSDFHTGHYDATSEGHFVLTYEADAGYSFGDNSNVLDFTVTHKTATECATPVAVQFSAEPTPASCSAAGTLDTSVFPIVREGYTLTVDRPFDGPGVYTITATADGGFVFSGDGNPTVRTLNVTVDAQLAGPACHVAVEPTLDATLVPMCIQNVPFLDYTAVMNDPDHKAEQHDNVSFTFLNTSGNGDANWVQTFDLTETSPGVYKAEGTFAWPFATYTGTLPGTITGTGWPGWEQDGTGKWISTTDGHNGGWTLDGVDVFVKVNPEDMITNLQYPPSADPCIPKNKDIEVSGVLDAPPAEAVEAEAQYAG